ncbi:hypothetical protein GCM10009122_14260 [Fulvivirga kasyanovii]|uniref:Uncharacterized protein n=1 Tax=Fulvivirga kasyanovii TaxID=396812 RepID=A0ABW9RI27_9BACT|nr:hypothetical protein [Fulvivirga kasyanovii]MTI23638.1 hypothetical protein [Fulvivirga kasyanovii]
MGCLKLTYSAENDVPNWKVWTAESGEKESKGVGNHWADGIRYSDWSANGGSDTYRQGLAMGLTDLGGFLYRVNSDGSRDLYDTHNGRRGFWVDNNGGKNTGYHYETIGGERVRVLDGDVQIGQKFVEDEGGHLFATNTQEFQ